MRYPFAEIEAKWQKYWEDNDVYKTDLSKTDKKLYHLNMFIYPSGDKLHTGHWYHYGPSDSWSRYRKLKGYNVFEPMGYDAFGLPAENYAIKTGIHPYDSTLKNIKDIRVQMKKIGCMYDWNAELMTCDPKYYRWNQWLFLQLYKKGLAYRKKAPVNWCPKDQTVLANEQVEADGTCERCGTTVIQRNLSQWFFKITDYADELLDGLDSINWPDKTKLMQRNWIGKSTGAEIAFNVEGSDDVINVFTTRPDTLFGATYMVLAPEHSLVDKLREIKYAKPTSEVLVKDIEKITKELISNNAPFENLKNLLTDSFLTKKIKNCNSSTDELCKIYLAYTYLPITKKFLSVLFSLPEKRIRNYINLIAQETENSLPNRPNFSSYERGKKEWGKLESYFHCYAERIDKNIDRYQTETQKETEIERTSLAKEKTGTPIGAYAINPANNEKIPILIADYVLISYGTGAIMAIPGQDERDWEFAEKFDLPIIRTVQPPDDFEGKAFTGDGPAINSDFLNGLNIAGAKKKIISWLEEKGIGKGTVNYRLRDWLISRQRYWGTPIPIIHCEKCGEVLVDEKDLPIELPYDIDFKPGGESPLAGNEKFSNVKCPKCKGGAKRDPDTMDTFVDSSWYYFRYLNPNIPDKIFDIKPADDWIPVDMYVGGAEHATMHLLYARFIHKFIRDLGLTKSDEPFKSLIHQGTITNSGVKMSKSKGNVVNPDEFTVRFGSDVFRLYLMFMGPYEMGGDWSDKGISGTDRFVNKVYDLFKDHENILTKASPKEKYDPAELSADELFVYKKVNQTLNKVNNEIEHFHFNTAIAALMELLNNLKNLGKCSEKIQAYVLNRFAVMTAPLAPHLGEECWLLLGNTSSLYESPVWYEVDPEGLVEDSVNIAVQVNGKLRSTIQVPVDSEGDTVKAEVFGDEKVIKHTEGKSIIKEIYVKNKIYNIVVK